MRLIFNCLRYWREYNPPFGSFKKKVDTKELKEIINNLAVLKKVQLTEFSTKGYFKGITSASSLFGSLISSSFTSLFINEVIEFERGYTSYLNNLYLKNCLWGTLCTSAQFWHISVRKGWRQRWWPQTMDKNWQWSPKLWLGMDHCNGSCSILGYWRHLPLLHGPQLGFC